MLKRRREKEDEVAEGLPWNGLEWVGIGFALGDFLEWGLLEV
jgi:hypothetical protein